MLYVFLSMGIVIGLNLILLDTLMYVMALSEGRATNAHRIVRALLGTFVITLSAVFIDHIPTRLFLFTMGSAIFVIEGAFCIVKAKACSIPVGNWLTNYGYVAFGASIGLLINVVRLLLR